MQQLKISFLFVREDISWHRVAKSEPVKQHSRGLERNQSATVSQVIRWLILEILSLFLCVFCTPNHHAVYVTAPFADVLQVCNDVPCWLGAADFVTSRFCSE